MNKIYIIAILFLLGFPSCEKEHDHDETDFAYHAHVHSPNSDNKHLGDMLEIEIEFESHSGQPVHHINVRIYNKNSGAEIYNKPSNAHIHETSGVYEYKDSFVLSNENGVEAHADLVLEAKVWGHEAGEGEEVETVEFHVHP